MLQNILAILTPYFKINLKYYVQVLSFSNKSKNKAHSHRINIPGFSYQKEVVYKRPVSVFS